MSHGMGFCLCVALLGVLAVGTADGAEGPASPWAAVARVLVDGDGLCSGVLAAPDLVLTAGHCVPTDAGPDPVPRSRLAVEVGQEIHDVIRVERAGPTEAEADPVARAICSDWAALRLAEPSAAKSLPYRGPQSAQDTFASGAPVMKVGYLPGAEGTADLKHDYACSVLGLHKGGCAFLYRCPGGAGTARSGSPILMRADDGYVLLGIQTGTIQQGGRELGVAAMPPVEALDEGE
jgi:protease YdgD